MIIYATPRFIRMPMDKAAERGVIRDIIDYINEHSGGDVYAKVHVDMPLDETARFPAMQAYSDALAAVMAAQRGRIREYVSDALVYDPAIQKRVPKLPSLVVDIVRRSPGITSFFFPKSAARVAIDGATLQAESHDAALLPQATLDALVGKYQA